MAKTAPKTKKKSNSASKVKSKPKAKVAAKPKAAKKPQAAKKKAKPVAKARAKSVLKSAAKAVTKAVSKAVAKVKAKAAPKASSKLDDYSMVFTPLDDRVLVLKNGVSNRTPGGLYIPDTVSGEDRPSEGSVVAVGPGHRDKKGRLRPLDVQIGDQVMFNAYSGSEVKIDTNELLCLRESDIIAIVKD